MTISVEQQEFLSVLEEQLGIVSIALKMTDITRDEYDEWLNNIFFLDRIKQIEESCVDYVETQLLNQIKQGNTAAITFYLKTKGKDRGY
jgi:hypothetical protein